MIFHFDFDFKKIFNILRIFMEVHRFRPLLTLVITFHCKSQLYLIFQIDILKRKEMFTLFSNKDHVKLILFIQDI